ncbi:hypothetical protein H6P81_009614 [Aristolochia fimbriata]|uniref:Uncharacterized protein n=1 Tax=Aristolochia fimbriata TaxID=158543 RepID=A0AAV7EML6_ARIFI|nr:hypothetical protein H6P81_009614 [Aristolochia fimbriata]
MRLVGLEGEEVSDSGQNNGDGIGEDKDCLGVGRGGLYMEEVAYTCKERLIS